MFHNYVTVVKVCRQMFSVFFVRVCGEVNNDTEILIKVRTSIKSTWMKVCTHLAVSYVLVEPLIFGYFFLLKSPDFKGWLWILVLFSHERS